VRLVDVQPRVARGPADRPHAPRERLRLHPALRRHLDSFAESGTEGLVFVGDRDGPLRWGNFHRSTKWTDTVVRAGLPRGFHFHDLRHTGNQLAAAAGASTRELMHRMGHGSMRAALIYQHSTSERDRLIADRLSTLVESSATVRDEPADES
jgi:integrase